MFGDKVSRMYKALSSLNEIKWSVALKGLICGIVTGLLVVLYRLGTEFGNETAVRIYSYLKIHPLLILPWTLAIAVFGLLVARLVKLEPMAVGSGIPQVEGQVLYGMKIKWYSVLFVRFLAGIVTSFFGLSVGREGPSIQIGASGSHAVAKGLSKTRLEENHLITGGAAAGLSAAFNAPLSGIVFALEEVHRSFSGTILIAATTASLTADVVSKFFFGLKPVLSFTSTPQLPQNLYIWLLPVGILAGLAGALMNKGLLGFQTLYKKLPPVLRPCIAMLIALPCGLLLPQVLGGGLDLISIAENADSDMVLLLVFLAVKIVFTCTSFGSGVPGGIFMPILSVGALTGCLFGMIAVRFGMPSEYVADFAVCAMAGALSGSVKAPVTSILLIAEMTGSLVHLLPVAICSFAALFTSDVLKISPIYETLLERIIESNEKTIKSDNTRTLLEVPVEYGSCAEGKMIREINWPAGTLIVGIHRGSKDIVPNGKTVILAGDYLVIMSSVNTFGDLNTSVRDLCRMD